MSQGKLTTVDRPARKVLASVRAYHIKWLRFSYKNLAHFTGKTGKEVNLYPIQQNHVKCYGYDVQWEIWECIYTEDRHKCLYCLGLQKNAYK